MSERKPAAAPAVSRCDCGKGCDLKPGAKMSSSGLWSEADAIARYARLYGRPTERVNGGAS